MAQTITITESELREMVYETIEEALNEGMFDRALEKGYNFTGVMRNFMNQSNGVNNYMDFKKKNPFTYNKKQPFNPNRPKEGSEEHNERLNKASDKHLMDSFYFYSEMIEDAVRDGEKPNNQALNNAKKLVTELEKYGLNQYARHLMNLIKMCP